MDAREYLEQIERSDERIRDLRFEIERLEELSKNLSSAAFGTEKVMSTKKDDKVAMIIAKLMDKKDLYAELIGENEEKRDTIIKQIYSLDDNISSKILFSIFVERKSYQDVATETDYSYDHVRRLCRQALKEFNEKCVLP